MKVYKLMKILIIKHGSLGDIISATSPINDIKNHYKNSQIFILTSEKYKNFFIEFIDINKIIIDNRKGTFSIILILKKIFNINFDLIIDLQNSQRTNLYAFFLRIFSKVKISGTGFFSTHRYKYSLKYIPSVINGLSNQIEILGIHTKRKPHIEWLNKKKFNFQIMLNKNFFIINPGCSKKNYQKKWSAENYAKVCSFLVRKNILPVLIGSTEDREQINNILLKETRVLNLLDKSPLNLIYELSLKALGAVSNDTGPSHLIAASGCKIHLVLSSISNVKTVIPQGKNVSFTQNNNIVNVSSDVVIKKINEILIYAN